MDILALLLMVALYVSFAYMGKKEKRHREEKEWIFTCRDRLHSVARRFRDECMEEANKVIAKYTYAINRGSWHDLPAFNYMDYKFIHDYYEAIDARKEEYLNNYAEKYADGNERFRIEPRDLPAYILDEYKAEISEIASSFHDIGYYMSTQIDELKQDYYRKNYIERS